ncbi:MAG: EthD family reductase [Anaerolineales bacterium]
MYKLVILIEPQVDSAEFDRKWPTLLTEFERMPGLRREVTSRVDRVLAGNFPSHMIHELFFDSLKSATEAMASLQGQSAGQLLQELTGGKVTLLLADHLQDDLARFQRQSETQEAPPTDRA